MDANPLLSLLDGIVRGDRGASGLRGTVCVVVREERRDVYWSASFGLETRCGFVDEIPRDASAVLLMGRAEADAILESARVPQSPELLAIAGDTALLEKVVRRYLSHQNMVGLRASIDRSR